MRLPAAKKQKDKEEIPRSAEPVVNISPRHDGRWKVYVRLEDGRTAHTTWKTEADAKDRAADFVEKKNSVAMGWPGWDHGMAS